MFLVTKTISFFFFCFANAAYAKLHGSYAALEAGLSADGMIDLTGGIVETIDMKKMGTKHKKLPKELRNDSEWDYSVLWKRLKKAYNKGFLVSCSNKSEYDQSRQSNKIIATCNGIILSHSYSISRVVTLHVSKSVFSKTSYHLLAVRNVSSFHRIVP